MPSFSLYYIINLIVDVADTIISFIVHAHLMSPQAGTATKAHEVAATVQPGWPPGAAKTGTPGKATTTALKKAAAAAAEKKQVQAPSKQVKNTFLSINLSENVAKYLFK